MMSARELLDAVEARSADPYRSPNRTSDDVRALVAALRAVLDLAVERGDHDPTEWVRVRDIRAAIDTHLGGAS